MTFDDFKKSLSGEQPEVSNALLALWLDAKGDWNGAHNALQDGNQDDDWVHAYLHRKEGDLSNARYWYNCAGREMPELSLEEEWNAIAQALLAA